MIWSLVRGGFSKAAICGCHGEATRHRGSSSQPPSALSTGKGGSLAGSGPYQRRSGTLDTACGAACAHFRPGVPLQARTVSLGHRGNTRRRGDRQRADNPSRDAARRWGARLKQKPAVRTEHRSVPATGAISSLGYARAAGLGLAVSSNVARMLDGTGSKRNGSMEYEARPLDNDRIAVA